MCCSRLAKIQDAKKSLSAHHHTTLSGSIFATKALIDNPEKTCQSAITPPDVAQYGELWPTSPAEIGPVVWGTELQ